MQRNDLDSMTNSTVVCAQNIDKPFHQGLNLLVSEDIAICAIQRQISKGWIMVLYAWLIAIANLLLWSDLGARMFLLIIPYVDVVFFFPLSVCISPGSVHATTSVSQESSWYEQIPGFRFELKANKNLGYIPTLYKCEKAWQGAGSSVLHRV